MHPGQARGKLLEVDTLEAGSLTEKEDVVLLVNRASGDEEVGAVGPNLRGVILKQALPHLSHLGTLDRTVSMLHPMRTHIAVCCDAPCCTACRRQGPAGEGGVCHLRG